MAKVTQFFRTKCSKVERMDDQRLKVISYQMDSHSTMWGEMELIIPDLEITNIRVETGDMSFSFPKLLGAKIGAGIRKIIGSCVESRLKEECVDFFIEDMCDSVILLFTKKVLSKAPRTNDLKEERAFFMELVKKNTRLLNSCAALSTESPLLEGIDLKQE